MSSQAAPSPPAAYTIVLARPRDTGPFCCTDDADVEDWLALYECVSKHNRWDATQMLASVIFYLTGTARVWFENHEDDLTSWQKLRDLFGNPIGRQLAAKKDLLSRAQTNSELCITYIQDVLAFCRKLDNAMSVTDKVCHILKRIADDAFDLLCKDYTTVATFRRFPALRASKT